MDYVSSVVQGISSYRWLFQSGTATGTLIVAVICQRICAGSSFIVWDLIWRLLAGEGAFQNEKLEIFFQKNKDIERYQFIYRFNVNTIVQAERLITFSNQYDISISALQKIGPWLKIDGPLVVVDSVSELKRLTTIIGSFVSALLLLLIIAIGFNGSAQLETIATKVSFASDGQVIYKHFYSGQGLSLQLCNHDQGAIQTDMGFSKDETTSICKFYQTGEFLPFVRRNIFKQRLAAAIAGSIAIFGMFWCAFKSDNITLAKTIKKRIDQSL
jgi:hypothetical protein